MFESTLSVYIFILLEILIWGIEGKHFKLKRHHRNDGESLVLTVASRTYIASMAHGFLLKWAEIRGLQKIGRSPRANDPNNGSIIKRLAAAALSLVGPHKFRWPFARREDARVVIFYPRRMMRQFLCPKWSTHGGSTHFWDHLDQLISFRN